MATIQGIYVALFGRPADPTGLAYFSAETQNGADLTKIGDLAGTDEYQDRFAGQTLPQIVNSIYRSLFNRDADLSGLNYFVAELQSGRQSINTIAINILDGAQGSDLTIVNNKITAANNFTAGLDTGGEIVGYAGDAAASAGRAFLTPVGEATSSIPTPAATNAAIVAATQSGGGGTGSTFTLTTGADFADAAGSVRNNGTIPSDFKFSTANDTVIASTASLLNATANPAGPDTITDSSTTDEDIAQVSITGGTPIVNFTNIENFDLTFTAPNAVVFDATTTGVKDIDLFGAGGAGLTLGFVNAATTGVSSIDGSALSGGGYAANLAAATKALTLTGSAFADNVAGGAGADTFNMGAGADIIADGAGADRIVGGGGADQITLAPDSASDRIVFEATASANGEDVITGFNAGTTNGDILDVSAFLGAPVAFQAITDATLGQADVAATGNVIVIRFDADVVTEGDLEAIINAPAGSLNLAAETKYVIAVDQAAGAGGEHDIYYVTTGLTGTVTDDGVQLVGTVTTSAATDLAGANFA